VITRSGFAKPDHPTRFHSLSFPLDHSGRVNCPRDSSYYSAAPLEKVPDEASAPGNTVDLGFPDEVIEQLGRIPWGFNGSDRKIILRAAMNCLLIRAWGHGSTVTFEFTVP